MADLEGQGEGELVAATGGDASGRIGGASGVVGSCFSCEVVQSVSPERFHDPFIRSELDQKFFEHSSSIQTR